MSCSNRGRYRAKGGSVSQRRTLAAADPEIFPPASASFSAVRASSAVDIGGSLRGAAGITGTPEQAIPIVVPPQGPRAPPGQTRSRLDATPVARRERAPAGAEIPT